MMQRDGLRDLLDIQLAETLVSCLDLTDLSENCTESDVIALCRKARSPLGDVAAVCVYPEFVETAARELRGTDIRIATVIGFPGGDQPPSSLYEQTSMVLQKGAHEIDMVIPWKDAVNGHFATTLASVKAVKRAAGRAEVKVIIETSAFRDMENKRLACHAALEAGADFLKTSTGKHPSGGATMEDVSIMIAASLERNPARPGIKASGGIQTVDAALKYKILYENMTQGHADKTVFRLGASGLLDRILEVAGATADGKMTPITG